VNVTKKIQSRIRSIQSDLRKLSIDELDHVQSVTTRLRLGLGGRAHVVARHLVQRMEEFGEEEQTKEWQPSAALLSQSEAS
jgi:hypothetical protein